ncbi:MAG: hypothetical protein ACFFCS_29930 [Candidatus Hodarchaeota archaeon]
MQSICINKLTTQGPEIIGQFPSDFFKNGELTEVPMKAMPLNAKEGDFTTILFRDNLMIITYIFTLQEEEGTRPSLLSLSAALDDTKINPFSFKELFGSIIEQLKNLELADTDFIVSLLPQLYQSLTAGKSEIRITKTVSIKIEFNGDIAPPEQKKKKKVDKSKGMW